MKNKPGFLAALETLKQLSPAERETLLNNMAKQDPDLVNSLRNELVNFEDLLQLNSNDIAKLLQEVPDKTLALALRKTSEDLKAHMINSLPRRKSESLIDQIEEIGPQPLSQVQEAQNEIIKLAEKLKLIPF